MKKKDKISNLKLKKIILHFCVDIEASKTAILTGINRNTINAYFNYFRSLIAVYQIEKIQSLTKPGKQDLLIGSFEDLLVFIKSKVIIKQMSGYPVYGLFEQDGLVYCEIINDNAETFRSDKIFLNEMSESIYSKGFTKNYNAILFGMFPQLISIVKLKQTENNTSTTELTIQSFWSFSKRRLGKFNGISKHFFYHLKECEWRWKKKEMEMVENLNSLVKNDLV